MNDPIRVSYAHEGVAMAVDTRAGFDPFDLDTIEQALDVARTKLSIGLAENKFVHDFRLLRTALYGLAHELDLAAALAAIEEEHEAERSADAIVHSILAGHGWKPVTPVDGRQPVYRPGSTGILSGHKIQVELGKEHAGDVIVSLVTGQTLVAGSSGAYIFHWNTLDREKVVPNPDHQWWWTRNYMKDLGHDVRDRQYQARKDLRTPALPVDLNKVLDRFPD